MDVQIPRWRNKGVGRRCQRDLVCDGLNVFKKGMVYDLRNRKGEEKIVGNERRHGKWEDLRRNRERNEYNEIYTTTWNRHMNGATLHVSFATRTTTQHTRLIQEIPSRWKSPEIP